MSNVELYKEMMEYIKAGVESLDGIRKDVSNIVGNLRLILSKQITKTLKAEEYDTNDIEPKVVTKTIVTEEVIQDLKKVTPMLETPKSVLCVKNGYMKYIPFQYIIGEYTLGTIQDIELKKEGKWILTKPWDKFEVRKS